MRFTMEKCLTENFLMKFGIDYFGKKDLIYIDMRGEDEANLHSSWDKLGPDYEAQIRREVKEKAKAEKEAKAAAKAAAGGGDEDDGGDDGGDDGDGGDDE